MAKKNIRKRSTGWAHTKKYPHKNHPAYFRKTGQDDIEYVTFTHSEKVDFDKENKGKPIEKHDVVKTRKLKVNIDKSETTLYERYGWNLNLIWKNLSI